VDWLSAASCRRPNDPAFCSRFENLRPRPWPIRSRAARVDLRQARQVRSPPSMPGSPNPPAAIVRRKLAAGIGANEQVPPRRFRVHIAVESPEAAPALAHRAAPLDRQPHGEQGRAPPAPDGAGSADDSDVPGRGLLGTAPLVLLDAGRKRSPFLASPTPWKSGRLFGQHSSTRWALSCSASSAVR
jgi:hypothetical protein